jgi:RNA polymerase sigma factor for flagellar operon FliA
MTAVSPATAALWERYREHRDPEARRELLEQHVALVHHVARSMSAKVGDAVPYDDLLGAGTIGLVQALEAFDPDRGFAFTTYAMQRIRGAMLDELRAADWRPRSVRTRGRQVAAAAEKLAARMGRTPRPQEVADELGVDLATYWAWRGDAEGGTLVAFDAEDLAREHEAPSLADVLCDPDAPCPSDGVDREDKCLMVQRAIESLAERQRLVLTLYYYEELNLKQIAEVLHVTESRVSQIRTAALARLRVALTEGRAA